MNGKLVKKKLAACRDDFPLLRHMAEGGAPFHYLDNAATTHKPDSVIKAITDFYTYDNANVGRGLYALAERATAKYEEARCTVQRFIGACDPSEIIFTRGATEGINLVATAWALHHLRRDDVIMLTVLEHHANLVPWQWVAQKTGARLLFIPAHADGSLDYGEAYAMISDKVKLLAITHSSNALGTHVSLDALCKRAQQAGAKVLVDASQSVPHRRINVEKMPIDFLVFSGHKMLGPTGIGVLYMRESESLGCGNTACCSQVEPYQRGGGMIWDVGWRTAEFLPAPHKFEAGTPAIAQAIGLAAAIEYLEVIDFDELRIHEATLCARLIEGLQRVPGVKIWGPIDQLKQEGHLVSFTVDGMHAHDVAAFLDQRGICVRAGHHCAQPLARTMGYEATVRVSFYLYNTIEDVDAVVEGVRECVAFAAGSLGRF